MRWSGVPAAMAAVLVGVAAAHGVDVPRRLECPSSGSDAGGCSIEWEMLSFGWARPAAIVAALALVLPTDAVIRHWAVRVVVLVLGIPALVVTAAFPLVHAALWARGETFYLEPDVSGEAAIAIGGPAIAAAVLVGIAALLARTLHRVRARVALLGSLGLLVVLLLVCLVVTLVTGLRVWVLALLVLGAHVGALVAGVRGHAEAARPLLWFWVGAGGVATVLSAPFLLLGGSLPDGDLAVWGWMLSGAPVMAIGVVALTGLMGAAPRPRGVA